MAGRKLKGSVKASSILEVVVSMIIIVVVFGIAMMIYTNVLRLSLSAKKLKAQALLTETLLNAERNAENTSLSFNADGFRIDQEVKVWPDNAGLTEIHLTAYDQNQQKIAELKKIIAGGHE